MGRSLLRSLCWVLITLCTTSLCLAETMEENETAEVMQGYLFQNALTQESYLITNGEELKAFVQYLTPTLPYKKLPAPPNPDPFLKGFTIDFEENILAVTVGRNRISGFPEYQGTEEFEDGTRDVHFTIPVPKEHAYPYGWAIYSAVILPRTDGQTKIVVKTLQRKPSW